MCSVQVIDYKQNADLNKKKINLDVTTVKRALSRNASGKLFYSCWKDRFP